MPTRLLVIRSLWIVSVFTLSPIAAAAEPAEQPLITTTGCGVVYAVPDQIDVSFGISTCDTNLSEAKRVNDERTQRVLAVAETFGVEDTDVQTSHMTISPKYHRYEVCDQEQFKGYSVEKTIVIRLRDVAKLESLVSAGLEAGANEINSITFGSSEKRKHEDQARLLAVRAAREKAVAVAAELGMSVGRPHEISEQPTQQCWHTNAYGNSVAYDESPMIEGPTPTFALGRIQFQANIRIAFQLRPQTARERSEAVSAIPADTSDSQLSRPSPLVDGNPGEVGLIQAPHAAGVGCIERSDDR